MERILNELYNGVRFIAESHKSITIEGVLSILCNTMQSQFLNIIDNIQEYFEGPLAQAFWANQFLDDVHGVMTSPQPSNAAWALKLVGEA